MVDPRRIDAIGITSRRRVILLIERGHHNLSVRLQVGQDIRQTDMSLKMLEGEWHVCAIVSCKERQDVRRRDERLHEDRGQLDKVGGASSARNVVIFCPAEHGWKRERALLALLPVLST